MADVNVNGDRIVRGRRAVNATSDHVGCRSHVRVPIKNLVQRDRVGDGHSRDNRAHDRLAGEKIGRSGVAIQIEVRAAHAPS